jgi:hypothetical protein
MVKGIRKARGHRSAKHGSPAQSRPMQGMDEKNFTLNDVVPLVLRNPVNNRQVVVIISADANGFTYAI